MAQLGNFDLQGITAVVFVKICSLKIVCFPYPYYHSNIKKHIIKNVQKNSD